MGHADLNAQDAGRQAPLVGDEDGTKAQGHHRHPARAAQVLRGPQPRRAGRKPLVARFGGIPLKRQKKAVITDRRPPALTRRRGKQLTAPPRRPVRAVPETDPGTSPPGPPLADLPRPGQPQPAWTSSWPKWRRKTLIVCAACHNAIHIRQPAATLHGIHSPESGCRENCTPVRPGGRRKRTHPTRAPRQRPTGTPAQPLTWGAFHDPRPAPLRSRQGGMPGCGRPVARQVSG